MSYCQEEEEIPGVPSSSPGNTAKEEVLELSETHRRYFYAQDTQDALKESPFACRGRRNMSRQKVCLCHFFCSSTFGLLLLLLVLLNPSLYFLLSIFVRSLWSLLIPSIIIFCSFCVSRSCLERKKTKERRTTPEEEVQTRKRAAKNNEEILGKVRHAFFLPSRVSLSYAIKQRDDHDVRTLINNKTQYDQA